MTPSNNRNQQDYKFITTRSRPSEPVPVNLLQSCFCLFLLDFATAHKFMMQCEQDYVLLNHTVS